MSGVWVSRWGACGLSIAVPDTGLSMRPGEVQNLWAETFLPDDRWILPDVLSTSSKLEHVLSKQEKIWRLISFLFSVLMKYLANLERT